MTEFDSAEMAGGEAVGLKGHIHGFNADSEARLANAMMNVGKWVEKEAGALMGHIKMAIVCKSASLTMSLTDLNEGVRYHGDLKICENTEFSFMAAVLDVDKHELEHTAYHALMDSGVNLHLETEHKCCGKHNHEHHHDHEHHDHDCKCHNHHDHEHGCKCHDHHDHEHHDHDCKCHNHSD